jgi:LacI family transcriptional regulator
LTPSIDQQNQDHPVPVRGARRGLRKRVLLVLSWYDYRHHAGVARYAAEHGWILEDAYTQIRALPDSWDGDGIISFHAQNAQFIEWLAKASVPVVDIGEYDKYSDLPRVRTDNAKIAGLAVDHFAQRGYKNVGFAWYLDNVIREQRSEAFRKAAESRGLRFFDAPIDRISSLRDRQAFPIALLAATDGTAVRALRACEDSGILVPEEVALLGIDNFEYRCVPASVPLSSIDPGHEKEGYEAAAMLDRLMQGQKPSQKTVEVPPVGIIERDSTNMLAVKDIEVAIALRFIIQNFRKRVGLGNVAEATSISLRRLQTRFKEELGRTILQEINGRRVKHAQKLLAETTMKIRSIAAECGFGSAVKMIRVFKQYAGTSPKRYRKQARRSEKV